MSQWYQVMLEPEGPYFFGQELIAELGNRQDYFRRSARFPQQSTLLGMLRHQLLLQNGLAIPQVAEGNANGLIGVRGFFPSEATWGYGKIKQLGPVHLAKEASGAYFLRNRDYVTDQLHPIVMGEPMEVVGLGGPGKALQLTMNGKPWNAKDAFAEVLEDLGGNHKVIAKDVFSVVNRVGVHKVASRKGLISDDYDEGYIRSEYESLKPGWAFAFHVEMEDETSLSECKGRAVMMGKEQSVFHSTISKTARPAWVNAPQSSSGLCKLLLLSDAFISDDDLYQKAGMVLGQTVRYRSLARRTQSGKHAWDARLNRNADRSSSYRLLGRGTVIYTESPQEVAALFSQHQAWKAIGNNYIMEIPKTK